MAEWYARKILNKEVVCGKLITYTRVKNVLQKQFKNNPEYYKKIMDTIDVILTQNGARYLIE